MEQLVARRAHNPEAVGSNPAPATKDNENPLKFQRFRGFFMGSVKNVGVVVTLIYFRALFFLKNDWF